MWLFCAVVLLLLVVGLCGVVWCGVVWCCAVVLLLLVVGLCSCFFVACVQLFCCCLSFGWCCFVVACRWGVWCCVCLWCWGGVVLGPKSSATGSPVAIATFRLANHIQDEVDEFCTAGVMPLSPSCCLQRSTQIRSQSILHRWCIVLSPSCCRHWSAQRRINQFCTVGIMPPFSPGYCRHRSAQRRKQSMDKHVRDE